MRGVGLAIGTLLMLAVLMPASATAQAPSTGYIDEVPAVTDLVAETSGLEPGSTTWLAFTVELAPGWHTYWENPGDSGLPLKFNWVLPPGFEIGEPVYPIPDRQTFGPIINYGFEDQVSFLMPTSVPENVEDGGLYYIAGQAEYLVCAEICIPAIADLSLAIVGKAGAVGNNPATAPIFAEARARLPQALPTTASAALVEPTSEADLIVAIPSFVDGFERLEDWYVFAKADDLVDHSMAQPVVFDPDANELLIKLPRQVLRDEVPTRLEALVTARDETGGEPITLGFSFATDVTVDGTAANALLDRWQALGGEVDQGSGPALPDHSLIALLGLALIGGLLLNLMPCVFPVLSLKLMAMVRRMEGAGSDDADAIKSEQRRQAWLYSAGVMAAMLLLAGAMLGLRASGAAIGWGFQLQSPLLIGALACVFFALALAMLGVFHMPQLLVGVGDGIARRQDGVGSFTTGVLAVIAASPCTAPFMATAIGAALLLPMGASLAIFAALGFGMALPLLLLSHLSSHLRVLPRPGPWMGTLQQFMAFPLFATSIWLVFVVAQQRGAVGVAVVLGALLSIGFGVWLARQLSGQHRLAGLASAAVLAIALPLGGLAGLNQLPDVSAEASGSYAGLPYEKYSPARLERALDRGRAVFIDVTAAWCITCLVNEQVALSHPDVGKAFADADVLFLKADWTNRDPEITALLEQFGRLGLPLYITYQGGSREPEVLPQILLPGMLVGLFPPEDSVQQASIFDE
ncbi:MAG: thioredoxin family protein [Alphaproteobacteria bacterium]|nr:thioredoxin family protein [Alphaproteobacteria bacterium SS10]